MIKFRCLRDFNEPNTNFKVKKGDLLKVNPETTHLNWWKVKNCRTRKKGLIPKNFVIKDEDKYEAYEGFYNFSRPEAELKLMLPGVQPGTFLIRPSRERDKVALSLKYEKAPGIYDIAHYSLSKNFKNQIYINEGLYFDTIHELVRHYSVNTLLRGPLIDIYSTYFAIPPLDELEIPREQIELIKSIGKGNFGEVHYGLWRKNFEVAVKIINDSELSSKEFFQEASIIQKLQHPYILQLIGVCTKPENQPLYMITEFMSHGNIKSFLRKTKEISLEHLIQMIYQVAQGMQYLLSKGVIHRDLRADNILVANDMSIKIADFGLARCSPNSVYIASKDVNYPKKWASPELIKSGNLFNEKTDVWSYGITCYEILSRGGTPYHGETGDQVMEKVKNGYILPFPKDFVCPNDIKILILSCWKLNPNERPTFSEIVQKLKARYIDA